jgi:putative membrane protein
VSTAPPPPAPPDASPAPAPAPVALPSAPVRLHPLSPVVRIGRSAVALVSLLAFGTVSGGGRHGDPRLWIDLGVAGLAVVAGLASWMVTTWHVDGDSLQVTWGVIRRQTVRVPLSRVQAIDLVEPWLARLLGIAEVRVRTGGASHGDARLQYLPLDEAARVRASLLALAHGLPGTTPPPPEWPVVLVSNRRLIASTLITGPFIVSVLLVGAFAGLAASRVLGPAAIGAGGGSIGLSLLGLARNSARRLVDEWDFHLAEAPDGLRIRCGLGSRVAETIPAGRIQAVRMLEPFWWRPLGWYRLELHLAGAATREGQQPVAANLHRALLPVGTREEATRLLGRILPGHDVPLARPPRRSAWRAPFSYHYLGAGHSPLYAAASGGRFRRRTEWAPLSKIQSIRSVQGPLQRWLGLATVSLDIAGRHSFVGWEQRDRREADALMAVLPADCALARLSQQR